MTRGMSFKALLTVATVSSSVAISSQASAQRHIIPTQNDPQASPSRSRLAASQGPIDLRATYTQRRALAAVPKVQKVVRSALANPESASFTDLRVGDYRQAVVICGTVNSQSADGLAESRRFIARSNIATFESPENHDAFRAGWRQTGCGV